MKEKTIYAVLFIFVFISTNAQQFLNLDFERKSVEGISRPWGWELDRWGTNAFSLDSTNVKSGKFSLKALSHSMSDQLPALQYNFEPYHISGKTIQLKGNFKSQIEEGNSKVYYGYVFLDNNVYSDSSIVLFEINESHDQWQSFDAFLSIPKNVTSVFVKIAFNGKGNVWYDDLSLTVDHEKINQLPVASNLTVAQINGLINEIETFDEISPFKKGLKEFDFMRPVVGSSRILALGESTHGTSDFFTLKHLVFRYSVEELGFRVFALEDNQLSCERVNQYILGELDVGAREAMSNLFDVWNTEEMRDLIEWMKRYNENHPNDPVYFSGFDMQDYKLPLMALNDFFKKKDKSVRNKILKELDGFESYAKDHLTATDSIKQMWFEKTSSVLNELKGIALNTNQNNTPSNIGMTKEGVQYARLLKQFSENVLKGHWSLYRDEAMAENIEWLAEEKYKKQKMFVWAHDVHVSKSKHPNELYNLNNGIAMGSFLDKYYKDDYKVFGLMTYSGDYLALKSYTNHEKVNAPLYPAPKGSLEEALHNISQIKNNQNLFLSFKKLGTWFEQPLPLRFANHVNIDYGFWLRISLPYQFDGVFFMDKTKSSSHLKK